MKKRRIWSIIAVCLMISTSTLGLAEQTITVAYNGDPGKLAAWKLVHLATEEMFRRLNITLQYKVLPARRASKEANEGRLDGDNARIYGYDEQFPNLVRVEEAIYTQELVAYATDPAIQLQSWDSLRETSYRVEHLRGVVFVEKKLSAVVAPNNLSAVDSREQGLKILAAGRTDVFVDVEGLISSLLKQPEFQNVGIQQVGVLDSTPLYLYLHKKHVAVLPMLKDVLIQIKTEGLYDTYWLQAFGTTD